MHEQCGFLSDSTVAELAEGQTSRSKDLAVACETYQVYGPATHPVN